MRCAVAGCSTDNQSKKGEKYPLYRFPKHDKKTCGIWKNACKRDDNFNLKTARICAKHFHADDFKRDLQSELLGYVSKNIRQLKQDALPTLNLPNKKKENSINSEARKNRVATRNNKKGIRNILEAE